MTRARTSIVYCLSCVFLLIASQRCHAATSVDKDAESRIAFYQKRAHGPATYPAYAQLGLALLDQYRTTGQVSYYEQALRALEQSLAYQRNFEAILGMARALAERHDFRKARPYAEEAIATMPGNMDAVGTLFDILLALGKAESAQAILEKVTVPGFQGSAHRAAWLEYHGDLKDALHEMTKAQSAGPPDDKTAAWAEVRIGSLHMTLCHAEEARAAYERALVLEPGYFFANEHLAEWHAAQGEWAAAEQLFRQLLQTRPESSYRIGLAEALRQQGKAGAAQQEEEKAVAEMRGALEAGAKDQFRPLALWLLSKPETAPEGLEMAKKDWEIRQDAAAADTLAWANFRNQHMAEALRLSEQALKTGSRSPALLLHGGLIRCAADEKAAGARLLKDALSCPLAFGPHERMLAVHAKVIVSEISRSLDGRF